MPLEESVKKYIGKKIFIKPIYGWGWSKIKPKDPPLSFEEAAGPPPFHLHITSFYSYHEELRGAIGKIEENGHIYNGFWAVFYTRHIGFYNFTDQIETYNILVGPDEPIQGDPSEDPRWAENWPIWHFKETPQLLGFAYIAETNEDIERYVQYMIENHRIK